MQNELRAEIIRTCNKKIETKGDNVGLAQGKGRSGLNWFLLSIFLGPVASFLVVVME